MLSTQQQTAAAAAQQMAEGAVRSMFKISYISWSVKLVEMAAITRRTQTRQHLQLSRKAVLSQQEAWYTAAAPYLIATDANALITGCMHAECICRTP
jgi:hypothetical protein